MQRSVQILRDAGFREDVAHIDEHGQGQHRVPVEQLEHLVKRQFHSARSIKQEGGAGGNEADGGKDALARDEQQHH